VELADYLRILRNHWIAVVASIAAFAVLAFVWSSLQTPVYAANSKGLITAGQGGDPGLNSLNDSLSRSRAATYVELATDRKTASIVIEDLGLDATPEQLVQNITGTHIPDTVVIEITAKADSPQGAQQLADAWVKALAQRVADFENGGKEPTQDAQGNMRIEVSENAQLPTSPISPNVPRNLLIGAVLGLLLGMGYAIGKSMLDRRLRTADEVERAVDVSVAGTVPEVGEFEGLFIRATGATTPALAAEAIRRLRSNLSYMDVDNPPRVIVITSPKQGDGKSTVSSNLAGAIALSGQQVFLVDADLRRPRVATVMGLDDTVGLTDVLTGKVSLADALQPHPDIEGLYILTSGSRPPNPSEILGSQAMHNVLDQLAAAGMVIVDAPPLLPVTDAAIVAHAADGALITISAGKTLDTDLQAAVAHLENVNARALGVVINRVSKKNVGASQYTHYSYDTYTPEPGQRRRVKQKK
jgi:capsular exopolysaccharide synthesis family protein